MFHKPASCRTGYGGDVLGRIWHLHHGDNMAMFKGMADNSVDAVVTDPPYGIGINGLAWDGAAILAQQQQRSGHKQPPHKGGAVRTNPRKAPSEYAGKYDISLEGNHAFQSWAGIWASECLRVLKPGGHAAVFGSSRTFHRLVCGFEDTGFEVSETAIWLRGDGMPKSRLRLKPSYEPILLGRKPLSEGTCEANTRRWGTGGLNIDACRLCLTGSEGGTRDGEQSADTRYNGVLGLAHKPGTRGGDAKGRWPSNVVHDGSVAVLEHFPDAAGQQGGLTGDETICKMGGAGQVVYGKMDRRHVSTPRTETDTSASRFFYCARASKHDRAGSKHPTVKPVALMRWLVRLITPVGGLVLDPFGGSGTTGAAAILEGRDVVMAEREDAYVQDILSRMKGLEK